MTRLRIAMIVLAVLLPALSLIPLGSLWLWQHGWLMRWVAGALVCTLTFYAIERRALPPPRPAARALPNATDTVALDADELARRGIEALIAKIDPAHVRTRAELASLAVEVIEIVANQFHPKDRTPVWNFTIPEALLLTERVSSRLRTSFVETVPLGERLTVGQLLRLYEWRTVAGTAEKLYDLWRMVRILNPVAAITQEARERFTKQIITSLQDDFTKRILAVYVREIGSAAIELYSGRLHSVEDQSDDGTIVLAGAIAPLGIAARPQRTKLGVAWSELKKVGRSASALYRRTPKV